MGSMANSTAKVMPVTQLKPIVLLQAATGLGNMGNTCFLNSVLQCLAYVPPLADACLRKQLHGINEQCPGLGKCCCCLTEAQLRNQLHASSTVYPRDIVGNLHLFSKMFQRGRQEDSHEFLLAVLDAVERDAKRLLARAGCAKGARTLIEELFCGRLRSQVRCQECGHCSNTYEQVTSLSLDILRAASLHDSLAQFTAVEVLDGANKYKCDRCARLVRAHKAVALHHEPNVLVVHLKRFDPLSTYGKVGRHVAFEHSLRLGEYCSDPEGGGHAGYLLTGVVVHQGSSLGSGHYYAYVRDSKGAWFCANDSEVHQVGMQQVLASQAYLLFYCRTALKPLEAPPAAEPSPAQGQPQPQPQPSPSNGSRASTQFIGPQLPPTGPRPAAAGLAGRQLGRGSIGHTPSTARASSEGSWSEGKWQDEPSVQNGHAGSSQSSYEAMRLTLPLKPHASTASTSQPPATTTTTTHLSKPGSGTRVVSLAPKLLPAKPALKQQAGTGANGTAGNPPQQQAAEASGRQHGEAGSREAGSSRGLSGKRGREQEGAAQHVQGVQGDEPPAKKHTGLQGALRSVTEALYTVFRSCPGFIADVRTYVAAQLAEGKSMEQVLADGALKKRFMAASYRQHPTTVHAVLEATQDIEKALRAHPHEGASDAPAL